MYCIAHRGFAEVHPENTVTAVEQAAAVADAVEVDVRRCRTGELVVIHDRRVDRVTDGHGRVRKLSRSALADMEVLDSGEGIPTLEAVLAAVPDGTSVVLELKEEGTAADALDAVDDAGVDASISSFSREVLAEADAAGDRPLAYLFGENGRTALDTATELGCAAVHPHWQLCVEDFVEAAHDRGFEVDAWTVPSRHDADSLAYVGVDGVIVDRPAVCVE